MILAHIESTVDYFPAHILIMHALWILVKVSLVWVPLSRNLLWIGVATLQLHIPPLHTHPPSHFSILQISLIILSNLFLSTGINLGLTSLRLFNEDDVLLHFTHLPSKLHYIFSLQQQLRRSYETWGGNNCWLTDVSWCPDVMAMSVILTCCHVPKWRQHLQQSPHLSTLLCQVPNLSNISQMSPSANERAGDLLPSQSSISECCPICIQQWSRHQQTECRSLRRSREKVDWVLCVQFLSLLIRFQL